MYHNFNELEQIKDAFSFVLSSLAILADSQNNQLRNRKRRETPTKHKYVLNVTLKNFLTSVNHVTYNSLRASRRFNQVVEAKRFKDVCLYVEKYAEFKNQTLKKYAGTQ